MKNLLAVNFLIIFHFWGSFNSFAAEKNETVFTTLDKAWGKSEKAELREVSGDKYKKIFSLSYKGVEVRKVAYIIDYPDAKNILWIFHGYKPSGDPYLQSPEVFFEKWKLPEFSSRTKTAVVCVDMGDSLYRFSPEGEVSDVFVLREFYNRIIKEQYPAVPVSLVGVSTGVEGALKTAPFVKSLYSIVGISGTFSFDTLPRDSGEYNLHLSRFIKPQFWMMDNPVNFADKLNPVKFYLLCEERSLYRRQAAEFFKRFASRLPIENRLSAGKKMTHGWNFWESPEVLRTIEDCLK